MIFDYKMNSLEDGPGIRAVIFMKGCPMDCIWCHNPEGKSPSPELWFDNHSCINCLSCENICGNISYGVDQGIKIDRNNCSACFKCTEVCPSSALKPIGADKDIDELLSEIMKYKDFYVKSRGGVTISGGEPLNQQAYVSELLKNLKREGLNTLIETSGYFDYDTFKSDVLPYLDDMYYDLKLADDFVHKRYCGLSNDLVISNLKKITELSSSEKLNVKIRMPLISGITDGDDNVNNMIELLKTTNVKEIVLLRSNPMWHKKSSHIGKNILTEEILNNAIYPESRYDEIKKLFNMSGIEVYE